MVWKFPTFLRRCGDVRRERRELQSSNRESSSERTKVVEAAVEKVSDALMDFEIKVVNKTEVMILTSKRVSKSLHLQESINTGDTHMKFSQKFGYHLWLLSLCTPTYHCTFIAHCYTFVTHHNIYIHQHIIHHNIYIITNHHILNTCQSIYVEMWLSTLITTKFV